jgi:hypothetical protein
MVRDLEAIEKAKAVLRENVYYVDTLYNIDDVKSFKDGNLTEEQAMDILEKTFDNERVCEEINFQIEQYEEEYF